MVHIVKRFLQVNTYANSTVMIIQVILKYYQLHQSKIYRMELPEAELIFIKYIIGREKISQSRADDSF